MCARVFKKTSWKSYARIKVGLDNSMNGVNHFANVSRIGDKKIRKQSLSCWRNKCEADQLRMITATSPTYTGKSKRLQHLIRFEKNWAIFHSVIGVEIVQNWSRNDCVSLVRLNKFACEWANCLARIAVELNKSNQFKWISFLWKASVEITDLFLFPILFEPNKNPLQNTYNRPKTRTELLKVSAAVMGIEFSYAAETAFVSPTLLSIGVQHQHMTLVWALSPLVGFFLTPIMGSLSDRCRLDLGRRRPFIILFSIGIFIGKDKNQSCERVTHHIHNCIIWWQITY